MLKLPDCRKLDLDNYLSSSERKELMVRVATKGRRGLEEFVERMSKNKDSSIARRIEKVRKDLETQSGRMKQLIRRKFLHKRQRLEEQYDKFRSRNLEDELKQKLVESSNQPMSIDDLDLEEDSLIDIILGMDNLGRERGKMERWWFRFKERLFRIIGGILRFFVWLLIKLRIMRPTDPGHDIPPYQFMLSFDAMRSPYASIEQNLDRAISQSPDMAKVVENKMGGGLKGSFKRAWEKMTRPDRFKKRVQEMIADELKEKLKETREESKQTKEEVERLLEAEQRRQQELQEEEAHKVKELTKEEKDELEKMYKELSATPLDRVKEDVEKDLKEMGLVEDKDGEMAITNKLLDIFSEIVFNMEMKNIPSYHASKLLSGGVNTGIFSTRRMKSLNEMGQMNIMKSVVESRIYNPGSRSISDDHVYVYEEEKGSIQHVILEFDKSGSMADKRKMEAAKRAILALYRAVKNSNSENIIDLVSFDTRVNVMDLKEAWNAEPGGFTNTGEALNVAKQLFDKTNTLKKSIYLVTDGLPEAFSANGREYAGDFEKSMEYALKYAHELKKIPTLKFTIILLEVKDEKFIDAAKKISDVLSGRIIMTNPQKLASELLVEYSKSGIM